MNLDDLHNLLADDLRELDETIRRRLSSEVVLINQLGEYIIGAGGKRLRPVLVLLASRALGYQGREPVELAAVVEFIHTATLLHDDVVDASEQRRGRASANTLWGNEAAVLVGDFLYSRAFQMMVEVNHMPIMAVMAETTNTIAEGEVQQLLNVHEPDTSEATYLAVIRHKTAKLFEAAARTGGLIAGCDEATARSLAEYGMRLGTAFQLVDDVLDYSGESDATGKNLGDDLAEGKPTLPLIHAMREGNATQRELIREAIRDGGREHILAVTAAIEQTGAIDYTFAFAREEAQRAYDAVANLDDSPYRDAMRFLAEFAVDRDY